jgi:putative aldouronate transport system permease protein
VAKSLVPNRWLLLMFLPCLLYFVVYRYLPMFGIVVAFLDYNPYAGLFRSAWVGLRHFADFFGSAYAWRTIRNTLVLSSLSLAFAFPAPIVLALLLNEVRSKAYKSVIQSVTYFPYFLSYSIVAGLVVQFVAPEGVVNQVLRDVFGRQPVRFLDLPGFFRPIYITVSVWKGLGFGAIIYLAAIAGIDQQLYEAATVDGAGRFQKMRHVTVAGIAPTVIVIFLLNIGHILSVGMELVLLLYSPLTYETADVIDTFSYRRGLVGGTGGVNFGLGAAVGLFKSAVGLALILVANRIARRVTETSLW